MVHQYMLTGLKLLPSDKQYKLPFSAVILQHERVLTNVPGRYLTQQVTLPTERANLIILAYEISESQDAATAETRRIGLYHLHAKLLEQGYKKAQDTIASKAMLEEQRALSDLYLFDAHTWANRF
ncbi:hypothetical protein PTT_15205 [Pyrenophora teres f. teres 0-1]|uniref:Uncharacterized protein n=1 Tax=Pyrenophora teres f. teres (strain 0-1) TaxID=861557 RepID=E3RZQ9_PYRTT|nr:hypothetical protein PTT_15205 [Pyrenophora teres f. teres 0-1]